MYRFILLTLLGCAAAGCMLPTDAADDLELEEGEQALYHGTDVPAPPPGSLLSRIVTVSESYGSHKELCTGTFITNRWIVTAAHCVENAGYRRPGAYVSVSAPGIVRNVILHPEFRRSGAAAVDSERMANVVADIALIEMDRPLAPALAAPLPILRGDLPTGTWLRCFGYGLPRPGADDSEFGTLREAWLPVRELTYTEDDPLSPRVGFTVGPNGDQAIAPGDSGGPCFHHDGVSYWLAGVHSGNTLGYFGNVESSEEVAPEIYIGWIGQYLANEITFVRATHRSAAGQVSEVTMQPGDIFSPFWQCTGQSVCNYPINWLGLADASSAADLTVNWRCGIYDFNTYSMNVAGPLTDKTASIGCPSPALSGIQIWSASYGQNCGVPVGNQTVHLAARCGGRPSCTYDVHHWEIGDPAPGCAKSYDVQYSCGSGSLRTISLPAEAGFGSRLTLDCAPMRTRPWWRW